MKKEKLTHAWRVGVPIIGVTTPDQTAAAAAVRAAVNGKAAAVVAHDIVRGLAGVDPAGEALVAQLCRGEDPALVSRSPADALMLFVGGAPARSILVMSQAHRWLEDPAAVQALMLARDRLKADQRLVVLMAPEIKLAPELRNDVEILDDPLPGADEIKAVVREVCRAAEINISDADLDAAAGALTGLSAYAVEQVAALSLDLKSQPRRMDVAACWERKASVINSTPGLKLEQPKVNFGMVGGLDAVKTWFDRLCAGPARPDAVIFVDEIEKALAGAGSAGGPGDSSGTSQDALGVLLKEMQDNGDAGMILLGPPGSGKSLVARAMAGTIGVPCLSMDLGSMKGSLVGQSEANIRMAMRVKDAVCRRPLWVGTCNRLDSLAPELRRRFTRGLWFCDLPDEAERLAILKIHLKAFSVTEQAEPLVAATAGWSGANIRDVAESAWALGTSFGEASRYVVPASVQDPDGITRLRQLASGRFISCSIPGVYRYQASAAAPAPAGRRMEPL
jgi:hypothetical protein